MRYSMVIGGLIVSLAAIAEAPYASRYLGTGRACYGTLTITEKDISWLTPLSKCPSAAYKIVDRGDGRVTFQLKHAVPACRYGFVSLVHHAGKNMDEGWEVMGYRDERTYLAHKASKFESDPEGMLSCYLIRDPNPAGPLDW